MVSVTHVEPESICLLDCIYCHQPCCGG